MNYRVEGQNYVPAQSGRASTNTGWWKRVKRAAAGAMSVAFVTSTFVAVGVVTAAPAAAADPFFCTPGAVYVQSTSEVREFDADTSTLGATSWGSGHSDNGLGISATGQYAYTVTNSSSNKTLAKHDRSTDVTTQTSFTLNSPVLRGAVHPVTGVYYFASSTSNSSINLYAWDESGSTPTYVQVGVLRPTAGSSAFGANGDMAFSASGQLVMVADQYIYSADVPATLVSSTDTIEAKQVHDMGDGVEGNGIAFGAYGHIFVSVQGGGNRIIEVDLARGLVVNTTSLGTFGPTDMASCTFPNTLTLKKDLPNGRAAATDQFGLRIDSPADYQVLQTNGTTAGSSAGLQSSYVGPVFTNQNDQFDLSEFASGTTDLDRYETTLSCVQANADGSTSPVPITAANQVTQPEGERGTEITCTFVNNLMEPALELRKSADPQAGSAVVAGQTVTYTVEAENTGNTLLDPVTVADDLSAVLDHATYNGDLATAIDGVPVTSGEASLVGQDLSWTGVLDPGQSLTITYSVVVNDDAAGETIANNVSASGTPPGPLDPIEPPSVTTEHPVAGFTVTKAASPAAGSVVEPGQDIEYTVTGTNTGNTVLDPVSIEDDLSAVLGHAAYNGDVTTAIDGTEVTSGAATITGDDLSWTGSLQAGEEVTITYSVTVGDDASGEVVRNVVTGSATPTTPDPQDPNGPGIPGEPIEPPAVTTEHPVMGSGFTVSKSANPASGAAVQAGDTIEYTVTGTNTGDTLLDPVTIADDLSAVLDHASYNNDATANLGTADVLGDALTWSGSIPSGEAVTITYSVTVDAGVRSALLNNVVTGAATPQIPEDPSDPDSPTNPGTTITPPPSETFHPVVDPGFTVSKSADPASGAAVRAGDTVEYTVTGTNTGNTVLDPVSIEDDLSAVLGHAAYNGDVTTAIDGTEVTSGAATITGDDLSWTGSLQAGEAVTITYSVTVDEDASSVMLRNLVSGEATPLIPQDPTDPQSPTTPGDPVSPPPVTTEHPVATPGFQLAKTADPASGTSVDPGSIVQYTVTGTNTGDTLLDPVTIADDLSAVLGHAAYNGDVTTAIDGTEVTSGAATITGDDLSWTGSLEAGEAVAITYSVTIEADAGGQTINNSATGQATPQLPEDPTDPDTPTTPGDPIVPPSVTTEHPVNTPGFTFTKTVDPASGTAVDPGQVLTYVLTGTNTGETELSPVTITDDLSGVLEYADLDGDPVATINGVGAADPQVIGTELSWTGPLDTGQAITIVYSVTVGPNAAGAVLENTATGTATPPGGQELTPPPPTTTTPVNVPGFSVSKSSNPETGTAVDPGSVITYTVTGVNTGEMGLSPVEITDDMAGVLAHAEYNDDAVATIGGETVAAPSIDEDQLTWSGDLSIDQAVSITYSVTVDADAGGQLLQNIARGSATPPGRVPPIETPPTTTENPVNEPGFELVKTANPESGTRVDPGSVIAYTVTGTNTGQTVLDPVLIADDLTGVLDHAVYNGDAAAAVNGEAASAPLVDRGALNWEGALDIGDSVTITYSVTVNGDAGGSTLTNVVSGLATPPGGDEVTPPPSTTTHPVATPGFAFQKTSDPSSGATVATGSVVTYTLTGVNTGETDLDTVTIHDDLSEVLPYATFNDDITVLGGEQLVAPTLQGSALSWSGSLAEGETVTVTYSVTVNADAAGKTLRNVASATASAVGGGTFTPPPGQTDNPILTQLAMTGAQFGPWIAALSVLLVLSGMALTVLRRRANSPA